ncbi:MAG: lipid-binding SYLF domain-containing protein [Bryobacteraceae bacterium]
MKLRVGRHLLAVASVLMAANVGRVLASTTTERLEESGVVLKEILTAPDESIPQDLLDQAHCVVIVPSLKKGAFVLGAKYGRGFTVCRHEDGRGWGAPAAVRVEGGSFGFQIGASETDLVLLVMNKRGMDKLLESKFTLGGAAEVAAGPVGRGSTAQTDAKMTAKILSYSRSRGVFAGISLQGATLREDLDQNEQLYGHKYTNRSILADDVPAPAMESELVSVLNRYSRHEIRD